MSVELSPETEKLVAEAVRSGSFINAEQLVETAIHYYLLGRETQDRGKFHRLRQRIEQSGTPLLSDEELRCEIRGQRGQWA